MFKEVGVVSSRKRKKITFSRLGSQLSGISLRCEALCLLYGTRFISYSSDLLRYLFSVMKNQAHNWWKNNCAYIFMELNIEQTSSTSLINCRVSYGLWTYHQPFSDENLYLHYELIFDIYFPRKTPIRCRCNDTEILVYRICSKMFSRPNYIARMIVIYFIVRIRTFLLPGSEKTQTI